MCLPSWDGAFSAHVEAVVAASPDIDSPTKLEAALRPGYPSVIVRPSELEGALRSPTWYSTATDTSRGVTRAVTPV